MKKFTDNDNISNHYANSETERNFLYDLIEENLSASIDGVDETKLSISGKEELVESLFKLTTNSKIDNIINYMKNYKYDDIVVEKDSLTKAFEDVNKK